MPPLLRTLLAAAALGALVVPTAAPAATTSAAPVKSENMSFVANLRYPELPARKGVRPIDTQGGTDLEFATLTIPETSVNEGMRGETRDFAVAGTYQNGLQLVDITDPRSPALAATYPCNVLQGDVQVFTRDDLGGRTFVTYAIDSSPGASPCFKDANLAPGLGTLIIEITDPYAPRTVSMARISTGTHNQTVHPSGKYLYNSESDAGAQLQVWDVTNPLAPKHAYSVPLTDGASDAHDITFNRAGTRAYVASITHSYILDTTNPVAPKLLGVIADPSISIHHQMDPVTIKTLVGDRTFVIINDEVAGASGNEVCPGGGLHVYDVTGPLEARPVKVGAFFPPEVTVREGAFTGVGQTVSCTSHVFRIYEQQALLTIAWMGGGVRVVDLSSLVGVSAGVGGQSTGQAAGMREIGFIRYREDSDAWAAKVQRFEADGSAYIFSNDQTRGFDVFRYNAKGTPAAEQGQWLSPAEALERAQRTEAALPGGVAARPFCVLDV